MVMEKIAPNDLGMVGRAIYSIMNREDITVEDAAQQFMSDHPGGEKAKDYKQYLRLVKKAVEEIKTLS